MTCIIVLGCFRSGTSAVAGVLHHLGVFMGHQFDDPNRNNRKGFWEDLEFKKLHEKYECGINVDEEYKKLVLERESNQIWGIKDPLLCKHLEKLTCSITDHKLIVCRRSIEDISGSMAKSLNISDLKKFEPLAQYYVSEMEKSLEKYKNQVLEIQKTDSMLQHLEKIANFVKLPVTDTARSFLG